MRLVDFVDGVGQLAAAPVLETMDGTALGLDHLAITLDHGRHLFTLVRVDQEYDFVMTHGSSLRVSSLPSEDGETRSSPTTKADEVNGAVYL